MSDTKTRIEEPVVKRNADKQIESVRLVFGPHHFVNVYLADGRVKCEIGATHHGIKADAAEVPTELERMIGELRDFHPDNQVD
jgi:hypothetical protein